MLWREGKHCHGSGAQQQSDDLMATYRVELAGPVEADEVVDEREGDADDLDGEKHVGGHGRFGYRVETQDVLEPEEDAGQDSEDDDRRRVVERLMPDDGETHRACTPDDAEDTDKDVGGHARSAGAGEDHADAHQEAGGEGQGKPAEVLHNIDKDAQGTAVFDHSDLVATATEPKQAITISYL